MKFVLVILTIGAASVLAHENLSENNFKAIEQKKQFFYKQPPTWSLSNYPTNWPSNLNQPFNWQNQPSPPWQSQYPTIQPNQPTIYSPNRPAKYHGSFGQENQMPYGPIPHTSMNWQSPQVMPGFSSPPYNGNFPYPQMHLYRMKNSEKL